VLTVSSADIAWNRRISSAIDDPREYWKLTDFVLKVGARWTSFARCLRCCLCQEIELSKEPELEKARNLVTDIRKRKLYRLVPPAALSV
jgi:hypothetical protein